MQKMKPALHECILCIPWRDDKSSPLPDTHAEQPLVPAGDDLGAGGHDGPEAGGRRKEEGGRRQGAGGQAQPGGQARILPVPLLG